MRNNFVLITTTKMFTHDTLISTLTQGFLFGVLNKAAVVVISSKLANAPP